LIGTINCLDACAHHKADIIFLSSSRVYAKDKLSRLTYYKENTRFVLKSRQGVAGLSARFGINEAFPLEGGRSLYGATKLCSEYLIREYIDLYGIRGVINRCGVISGPWQMGKVDQGFVVLWMAKHLWQKELVYNGYGGTGFQVRDVLHINDLHQLIRVQIQQLSQMNREIYNVGGGTRANVSLRELTRLCESITGNKIKIKGVKATHENDIPYYVSDCRKVMKKSNWRINYGIEDTLMDIYVWLIANERDLKAILA
jgi:CDP-paratose 2-epimerase